jgi:hypothetical protein
MVNNSSCRDKECGLVGKDFVMLSLSILCMETYEGVLPSVYSLRNQTKETNLSQSANNQLE